MAPENQAAWVIAQSVNAMIEAMGMAAENQHRISLGHSVAYGENAFADLPARHGIGINDLTEHLIHGSR